MIQEASCKHGKYKGLNHFFEIRETIFLIILRRLTQNQEKILVGEGGGVRKYNNYEYKDD